MPGGADFAAFAVVLRVRDALHGATVDPLRRRDEGEDAVNVVGVLFDGIAYGSLMFLIAIGLSITLGLMNFVNLAHGAFAMLGGYVSVVLMQRAGVPFLAALPGAFVIAAMAGVVLERTLYQRLYRASHLDQVLFSIGLVYISIAVATYFFGPSQQPVRLPSFLQGQVEIAGRGFGAYRLFLIATVAVLTVALQVLLDRTRFGAAIRASVDNPTAAAGLGINVNRVFALTFALGSGLAGLGGALGIDVLGEIIRATLTDACPEFTRPANSWICFGLVPTQSITVGFSISFGIRCPRRV